MMESWRKNLYITWIAQFIAMMGMSMIVPFLPFFVQELGVQDPASVSRWSGIVFSGPFIVSFFTTPFWGMLGDRFGRRLITVRAIFGLGIAQFLISASQNVYQLFVFRLIQGAISGFIPSALAFISAETPHERKGYALGVLQTATSAGQLFGPFFGGVLADVIGYKHIFQLTGVLCFIAGMFLIFGTKEERKNQTANGNGINVLISNYNYAFVQNKNVKIGLIAIFFSQTSVMFVQPIFALFIEMLLGKKQMASSITGITFSIAGAFTVLSAPWWGRINDKTSKRFGNFAYRRNLTVSLFGAGLSFFLQGIAESVFQVLIFRAIFGFFLGGITPALYSFISKNTEQDRQGGVMGIASSFTTLSNVAGPIFGGIVSSVLGLRSCFLMSSFLMLISLFVIRFGINRG